MDELTYHFRSVGKNPQASIVSKQEGLSIDELLELSNIDQKSIEHCFCFELRKLLKESDLSLLLKQMFALESKFEECTQRYAQYSLPSFEEIYKRVAPELMRALLSTVKAEENPPELEKKWLEGIRVAIEEELYFWKNKFEKKSSPIIQKN